MKNLIIVSAIALLSICAINAQEEKKDINFIREANFKVAILNGKYKEDMLLKHFIKKYKPNPETITTKFKQNISWGWAGNSTPNFMYDLGIIPPSMSGTSLTFNNSTVRTLTKPTTRPYTSNRFEGFSSIYINGTILRDYEGDINNLKMREIKSLAIERLSRKSNLYITLMN